MPNPQNTKTILLNSTELEKISLHLWIRYVEHGHELDKHWQWGLEIAIDEMTTEEELRNSWEIIKEKRDWLKNLVGSDQKRFSISLLCKLTADGSLKFMLDLRNLRIDCRKCCLEGQAN